MSPKKYKFWICEYCRQPLSKDDMANAIDHLLTKHNIKTEDDAKQILNYCEVI